MNFIPKFVYERLPKTKVWKDKQKDIWTCFTFRVCIQT